MATVKERNILKNKVRKNIQVRLDLTQPVPFWQNVLGTVNFTGAPGIVYSMPSLVSLYSVCQR